MDESAHKQAMRRAARAARQSMSDQARGIASAEVADRVLRLPELASVRAVLGYAALPEEVDPAGALETLRSKRVRVGLPKVIGPGQLALHWVGPDDRLVHSTLGIPEPIGLTDSASPGDFDVVLVPGVAFDPTGARIGFGGGFYDSLIPLLSAATTTVGLAFDEQMVGHIPAEEHDAPVDVVVTPSRVFRRSDARAL